MSKTCPLTIAPTRVYRVLGQRHEVMFRDGTAIGLHPLVWHGVPQICLRALRTAWLPASLLDSDWLMLDLRMLLPELESDLIRLEPRDHPGCVFYSLRLAYPTLAAFAADAQAVGWRQAADATLTYADAHAQHIEHAEHAGHHAPRMAA